jgi:hypothetical protein
MAKVERYGHAFLLGFICWLTAPRAQAQGFSRALKPLDDAADLATAFVAHRIWHAIFIAVFVACLISWAFLKRIEAAWSALVVGIIYVLYLGRDDFFSGLG